MIIGIGNDIISIKRIENLINKYGNKFINRCFSEDEIDRAKKFANPVKTYAKRYAAKEACAKALGTGLAQGIFWKDIIVQNNKYGQPYINLTDKLKEKLQKLDKKNHSIAVSLSDEKDYAIATAIIYINNEIS